MNNEIKITSTYPNSADPARALVAQPAAMPATETVECILARIKVPEFPNRDFPITAYGASAGADSTEAIRQAIAACHDAGGGCVVVPAGEFFTGPIHLKSNVNFHIAEGAILKFDPDPAKYPLVFTRWEGIECMNYSPLIYSYGQDNVAVTGKGILKGSGEPWWHWKQLQQAAATELVYAEQNGVPVNDRIYGTTEAALRPSFVQFVDCRNVWIQGIRIEDGPQWMLHPVYCEDVLIQDVVVVSKGPNTDGLNPDSCRNVLVERCSFETGDDCIAINSGMNEDGWRVGRPCENIVIRDCEMTGGHGGIVIGSGMSGGVRNVHASHCTISGTHQGIRLKSMRGRGGIVENVFMENIRIDRVEQQAIQINMFYSYSTVQPRTPTAPTFRNIHISDVRGQGARIGIELRGLPESMLDGISLKRIDLTAEEGMVCQDATGLLLEDVTIHGVTSSP